MRAAVQLAERVRFLRGSVRGSFSAPVFTPFPLRTNVRATEAHLQPWPGGLQVGCGRTVCLAHHSQREIFFCASWPRGYYPSRRERERAPFHVFTNWHSETSFFGYFWTSNSEKTYLINLGDYTNHFWFSKLQNSAVNPIMSNPHFSQPGVERYTIPRGIPNEPQPSWWFRMALVYSLSIK